jgi:divalent metal cation (Fe/Co/Zn/Cd) transporter
MSRRTLQRNAIIGFVASLILAVVKLLAGVLGRSSALVADAVESFADTPGSMLVWQALRELLDAASHELAGRITTIAETVDGGRQVEKVLVRKSGAGYHLDMHLHVDPELTIRVAHALAGKVKATLRAKIPNLRTVLIHVEPFEPPETLSTSLQH